MIRMSGQPAPLGPHAPVVHIVEDDDDAREATARLLRAAGYAVKSYASGAALLSEMPIMEPGCVLLDVQLPDASGLELHETMSRAADVLPVIFVTGHGDIPMSVRAIRAGAVDFLTKPVQAASLLPAVAQAVARDAHDRTARAHAREVQAKYDRLTPREREVFAHLISGQLNKQVAFDLGTKERTIKAHRHSILEKLGAQSIADLIGVATELHISPVRGA